MEKECDPISKPPKHMLASAPNPYRNRAYIVSISQAVTLNEQAFQFGLRYVPDKLLLDHRGLTDYLQKKLLHGAMTMEALAHDVLEDITDQIIPKWIEVNLRLQENKLGQNILITIEERQPNWENETLLKRLPAIF